jgi:hypothetical protein
MRHGIGAFVLLALSLSLSSASGQSSQSHHTVDSAIRQVLEQYSAAFQNLDPVAVKKVQPSIDSDTLREAFKQMRSLEVSISDVKVLSSDAAAIRVSCRVTQTLVPRAGVKQTIAVTRVLRLRRLDGALVIDAFER